jgi:hypothetical protein
MNHLSSLLCEQSEHEMLKTGLGYARPPVTKYEKMLAVYFVTFVDKKQILVQNNFVRLKNPLRFV